MGSALVKIVHGAVHLSAWIGGKLYEFAQLVIDTMDRASDIVTGIFNCLEAAAEKVVEWLSSLFNFEHIWNTKSAMESVPALIPDYVQRFLIGGDKREKVKAYIANCESAVLATFTEARAYFAGKSFQDLPGWEEGEGGARLGARRRLFLAADGGEITPAEVRSAEGDWIFDTLVAHSDALPEIPAQPGLQPIIDAIIAAVQSVENPFDAAFADRVLALFDPDSPETFGKVAVDALFKLLELLVKGVRKVATALVDPMFAAIDAAAPLIGQLLGTPITFAPIVQLVEWIYGQAFPGQTAPPLTVGGAAYLSLAFPTTLAWKLAVGVDSQPFPGGKLLTTSDEATRARGGFTEGQTLQFVGSIVQCIYAVADVGADFMTIKGWEFKKTRNAYASTFGVIAAELLIPVLIWPTESGIPGTPPDGSQKDTARVLNWYPGWVYLFVDLVCGAFDKQLARNADLGGDAIKIWVSTVGFGQFFGGCAESYETSGSGWAWTANLITPLSPMFQFLRLPGLMKTSNMGSLWAKLFLDAVGDAGGGIARMKDIWNAAHPLPAPGAT